MCGRIYIKATLEEMLQNFAFASRGDVVSLSNQFPRYNGAPSLYYPIIIRDMVDRPYRAGEGDDQSAVKYPEAIDFSRILDATQ